MNSLQFASLRKLIFLVVVLGSPSFCYSQVGCVSNGNQSLAPQSEGWIGHVYQLPLNTLPNVNSFPDVGEYKGALLPAYLPTGNINFITDFGNYGAPSNDNLFVGITDVACQTRLSYFGILFKGKYTLPETGTYKITIISDDGSRLAINDQIIHDRWVRQDYNNSTAKSYYVTNVKDFVLNMELRYYESDVYNKVSFQIERYYGPGVISANQRLSGVNPDPAPFISMGPASFETNAFPQYQWQYSNTSTSTGTWTDIADATGEVYDILPYLSNPYAFQGTRFFRRVATGGGISYISNTVEITLCKVNQVDHSQYGINEWIGYVYKGTDNFNQNDFLGRVKEPAEFNQNFKGWETYYPTLEEDGGCFFYTNGFTIQYKMAIWVEPGDYNFEIVGDDGFRLTIQDEGGNFLGNESNSNPGNYAIHKWTTGGATIERKTGIKRDILIEEGKTLYFVLDYFENIYDNSISFKATRDPFSILPLEWGQVNVQACEQNNCLSWETIQEKNTSHFELERSYNGFTWEIFDQSVMAQGYSTEKINYEFTDRNFLNGQVYYRIKQVDLDGLFAYSDVMRVNNNNFVKGFSPFPNPTTDKIRFFSKSEVTKIVLTSNDYSVNHEMNIVKIHDQMYEVELSVFRNGNYILTAYKNSGEREAFKIIKK